MLKRKLEFKLEQYGIIRDAGSSEITSHAISRIWKWVKFK